MSAKRAARNKNVALDAIGLLTDVVGGRVDAPEAALAAFHERWAGRGVWWTRPTEMVFDMGDWLPAAEMARLADVEPNTVHQWRSRGLITSIPAGDGSPLFNVGEVVRYQARVECGAGRGEGC